MPPGLFLSTGEGGSHQVPQQLLVLLSIEVSFSPIVEVPFSRYRDGVSKWQGPGYGGVVVLPEDLTRRGGSAWKGRLS